MALSTCAKCGGHSFGIQLAEPTGAAFKQNFVQCNACGVPVGVLGFFDTGAQLKKQGEEMGAIVSRLKQIEGRLSNIENALSR